MSTRRKFPRILRAALMAGLLVLSGCSSTAGDDGPNTPGQPTTELPSTTPDPTTTAATSTTESGTAPAKTSASSLTQPIPGNALAYADALVLAWGTGDRDRMVQLAEPGVLDVLNQYGTVGGPHWDQVGHDAGAGSVFVTYENTEDGTRLELRVRNEAAAKAQRQAVAEAKIVG